MKFGNDFLWISVLLILVREAFGATAIVYCEEPVTNDLPVSFCGGSITASYLPNSLGYAALNDDAIVVTSIWTSSYISIHTSQQTTSTNVRQAVVFAGANCPNARVAWCNTSKSLFSATITHYTIYAPTGDIATQISRITVTNSATVTATHTATVTSVTTLHATSTATVTSVTTLHATSTVTSVSTLVSTSTLTVNTGNTAAATVFSTLTVTEGDGTCPAAQTVTVTQSVTYNVGSGGVVTIYTSGDVPGTSVYTSCATTLP